VGSNRHGMLESSVPASRPVLLSERCADRIDLDPGRSLGCHRPPISSGNPQTSSPRLHSSADRPCGRGCSRMADHSSCALGCPKLIKARGDRVNPTRSSSSHELCAGPQPANKASERDPMTRAPPERRPQQTVVRRAYVGVHRCRVLAEVRQRGAEHVGAATGMRTEVEHTSGELPNSEAMRRPRRGRLERCCLWPSEALSNAMPRRYTRKPLPTSIRNSSRNWGAGSFRSRTTEAELGPSRARP
jgi:hypothetical protein